MGTIRPARGSNSGRLCPGGLLSRALPAGRREAFCRISSRLRVWFTALPLIFLCGSSLAQNAPGYLPWGISSSDGATAAKKQEKESRFSTIPTITGEIFRHAYGIGTFGFLTNSTNGLRSNETDYGLSLLSSGYFLDPRLWSQTLSVDLDHYGTQSAASRIVGFHLHGTLLNSRSFPLQITVNKTATNVNALSTDTTGTSRNVGLSWTLLQPKYINAVLNAQFGSASQNSPWTGSSFNESNQTLSGSVNRDIHGWSLLADASRVRVHTTIQNYQIELNEYSAAVDRPLGGRNFFHATVRHQFEKYSALTSNITSLTTTNARARLAYEHTRKLHAIYDVNYTSNLRGSVLSSALLSVTSGGAQPLQLDPGVNQALLSNRTNSSVGGNADWTYFITRRLLLGANIGHTELNNDGTSLGNPTLLASYTSYGGNASYVRTFGEWEANWRTSFTRYSNLLQSGGRYSDTRAMAGMGVQRTLRGWRWTSDIFYQDYSSGSAAEPEQSQVQWTNTMQRRLHRRLRVDLSVDYIHVNSVFPMLLQNTDSRNNLLQGRGTLQTYRWDVTGSTGRRNFNSTIFTMDYSNPLNSQLASQLIPLVSSVSSADRFVSIAGDYRLGRSLSFHGGYSHDSIDAPGGVSDHFNNAIFSASYRLRRTTIEAGYQREDIQNGRTLRSDSRIYVRVRRPFFLF